LSRGRGIKCSVKLPDILDHCISKELQYVVQKYIENPLIILQRKFDIRQWVLVEDYSKVWFYEESYLRFCAEPYDMDNVGNRFMHLTNNSIQKYSKEFNKSEIEGNMITSTEFATLIGQPAWEDIQKRMREIVILTIKATEDQVAARRNTFELFGYDFMVDS
jgi:tubulin monoglycylase TTLL3/8